VAHKTIGKRNAGVDLDGGRRQSLCRAVHLVGKHVPGDASWGLNTEGARSSMLAAGRIVIASSSPKLERTGGHEVHWLSRVTHRHQWARVLLSNSVQCAHRQLIFAVSVRGVLPWEVVWQIFLFNLVLKYAVTVVSMPLSRAGDRDWSEQ
jgi:hypothetical protein